MSWYFDEAEAVKKLQELGYKVVKLPSSAFDEVNTVKKLVDFFYARRLYYNPDRLYPYSQDYSGDCKILSSFVKSREKLGLSRKAAVQECARLVEALFKYEKFLHLEYPVHGPNILSSRPLVDRLCAFLNGEISEVVAEEVAEKVEKINRLYEEQFAEVDFAEAAQVRKKILEKLDVK